MPVGRVEHAALALRPDPRPWLATLLIHTLHQHGAVDRIVPGMDVSFVPGLEWLDAAHHRMRRLHDLSSELAGAMPLELAANQRDVFVRPGEFRGRGMERNHTVPGFDVIEERLLLLGSDCRVIAVQHQRVVEPEPGRRERLRRGCRVGELDAAARQGRGEEREHLCRIVRLHFVLAEEQDPDRPAGLGRNPRRRAAATTGAAPLGWRGTGGPAPGAGVCSVCASSDSPATDSTATPQNITHARRALALETLIGMRTQTSVEMRLRRMDNTALGAKPLPKVLGF